MPEGPEVKIVSDYFNENLDGSFIKSIECISSPYKQKYSGITNKLNKFLPKKFSPSFCRGKTTFMKLSTDSYFTYHLGMTGYWSLVRKKHAHLRIISSNKTLYFHDTRRFGNIKIISNEQLNSKYNLKLDLLNNTGPINNQIDFIVSLIRTKKEVCKVLLDQSYFLGVGNYLKSEILYQSCIHPNAKWDQLTFDEKKIICINAKRIMMMAYKSGGAQIRDFKNPDLDSSLKLEVYNKSITKKGELIIKDRTSDNRVSYWCPDVQKQKF